MIKINFWFTTFYIRTVNFTEGEIKPNSYIIDHGEDVSVVLYKHNYIIQIAEFKYLDDAVEYVKMKITSNFN